METVSFVRADEQVESPMAGPVTIDATPIVGHWINTNLSMPGIARVNVSRRDDGGLAIRVSSASGPAPREWGNADVEVVYSNGVASQAAMAFVATYDFGYLQTRVEANLSLGLLVVATFNTFTHGSGRFNYFAREFFYRAEDAPGQQRQETHE
jgi:hypothetical protein